MLPIIPEPVVTLHFEPFTELRCQLGESPVYDDRRDALFLCDIVTGQVHRIALTDGGITSWSFPPPVGSLGLAQSGRLVVALRSTVILFDPDTGAESEIADPALPPGHRLNDGKVGPDGAFWVGSMDDGPERQPVGTLYRVTAEGAVERKVEGLRTPNGLAFSLQGDRLYHSDSRGPWIDRWALDPRTGAISDRQRFITVDEAIGRPDGGATDMAGRYWSAGMSAGRLNCFTEDGELAGSWPTPAPAPTMPCFAGPDLRTLFVTSLVPAGAADHPLAGAVLMTVADTPGCPVERFRDG